MASRGPAAEWLRLNGELVTVPAAICEDRRLFDAVLSQTTWSALSEQQRHHLRTFLPKFDGDDAGREQDETIRRLFAGENFLCGSPLDECFVHLYEGRLTDEIHSLRRLTAETKAQDARVWRHNYLDDLLKELVVKRKLLLAAAVRTPPDTAISLPPNKKKSRRGVLEQRARKRYFQELEQARLEAGCGEEELSPDDNYPEGAPAPLTRKQQRHLTKLEASLGADHVVVTGTASRRHQRGLHLTDDVTPAGNPYEVSETRFAQLLMKHRKRRAKGQGPPACTRDGQHEELQSLLKQSPPAHSSDSESDCGRPPARPPAPPPAPSTHWEAAALGQQTHTCFFSLLRDVFCSDPDDRLAEADVYLAVGGWQTSPISPLNDWYQQEANWVDALASALAFLAGEVRELQPQINLVPFLNHGHDSGVYQWIGAGRDSDIHLESLCAYWIHRKDTISLRPEPPLPPPLSPPPPPSQPTPPPPTAESMSPVPPPLYPTTWTVQPSTAAEKDKYRQQERLRYQTPRRAFTYCLHGYRSVVGPVKGGGTRDSKAARGHALLVPDRPAYVTILTLVRDAVARLPNGEGSRSDVLELVRDSGYLAAGGEPLMAGAVSSALDRLHGEADPCVRYDSHRKLWIYLHRHRSEADFEAIDRQRQSSVARRRTATRRSAAAVSRTAPAAPAGSSLLKPRFIPTVVAPTSAQPRPVFTTAPPVPIAGAMQESTPALSQTELAVQSILPTAAPATSLHPARVVSATHMTASASTAPQLVAHSPTLSATVATVTALTSPVQQVAGVQSVKVVKNQHAIVQIPSKTPGAAPQLALLANGKLIPIVNQPQSLKSDVRSLSGGLAAARP